MEHNPAADPASILLGMEHNPVADPASILPPITAMMTVKRWSQNPGATSIGKPAIHPATVDLRGKAYEMLRQNAARFLMDDIYRNPGPL